MTSETALTEDDLQSLASLLEKRKAHGEATRSGDGASTRRERIRERPVFANVCEALRTFEAENRSVVNVREVADRSGHDVTPVGRVLSILGEDGRLELVSDYAPRSWKILS